MTTYQPHTRSPDTGLTAIQKMVGETVEYYLDHGGPSVARGEVRSMAATLSFMDGWPQAYRWAMDRISQAQKREQAEEDRREQPAASGAADLSDGHVCRCLERLMGEEWKPGVALFSKQNHWQAVFRVLSDAGLFADDDFDGFDSWVQRAAIPAGLRRLYARQSVKNISQTLFCRPLSQWKYDPVLMKRREPFDRMKLIAERLEVLLAGRG